MRLIDADNLKIRLEEEAKQIKQKFHEYGLRPDIINWVIDEMPTVEPRWDEILVICDNCGHAIHVKKGNET